MTMTKSEKKEQEKTPSKDGDETQKQEEKITPIKIISIILIVAGVVGLKLV